MIPVQRTVHGQIAPERFPRNGLDPAAPASAGGRQENLLLERVLIGVIEHLDHLLPVSGLTQEAHKALVLQMS